MSENTNTNKKYIDFLGKQFIALIIFAGIVALGLVSYFTKGVTLGTDFAGGIRIEFTLPETTINDIRESITNNQIAITTLAHTDGQENYLLTAPAELSQEGSGDYLLDSLREKHENLVVLSSNYVGPSIGEDFFIQALQLLGIVAALILVYVAFRFDFIYGVGAVMALLHDMIVMTTFTLLFQIPVDLTILAAFLTILGYSINDTIVIFDRVRENHTSFANEGFTYVVNKSISQSLTRTILTSVTTLFVAVAIYIWSGSTLKNFGLLLTIGIISGTYSSIFIASPITNFLYNQFNQKKAKKV